MAGAILAAVILAVDPHCAFAFSLTKYFVLAAGLSAGLLVSPVPRTQLDSPAAFYLFVLIVCSVFSIDPLVSFLGVDNAYYNAVVPSLLVFGCFLLGHSAKLASLLRVLVLSCVAVSLIAIAQYFGYFMPWKAFSGGRYYSTLGNPVFMSSHLALGGIAAIGIGWTWALPILAIGGILGASRAALLAFLAGILIIGLKRAYGQRGAFWTPSRALSAALLSCFIAFTLYSRATTTGPGSDLGRKHMYIMAWKVFDKHPVLGQGPETFFTSMHLYRTPELDRDMTPAWGNAHVHNSYLEALSMGGYLLFLAYVVLQFAILIALLRAKQYVTLAMGVGLVVFGLFQPTQLSLKAIYALILGASLEPEGEWGVSTTYLHRGVFLALALMVSVFYAGGRIHKLSERLQVNVKLFNASTKYLPTLYH